MSARPARISTVEATHGAIFTAFGQRYVDLAFQAAASLRTHNPGIEIDLFTDQPVDRGIFDRVHVLEDVWIRSKLDTMLASRFDRTLFLDADLLVLADISDVFALLDRFDMAMVHDVYRSSKKALTDYRSALPNSFPQLNSGVFAFRRSDAMTAFLHRWKEAVRDHGIGKDQPSLRSLLWESDLRVAVLPPEYNLYDHRSVDLLVPGRHAAPRILHSHRLLQKPLPSKGQDRVAYYFGRATSYKVSLLAAADHTLARGSGKAARRPTLRQNIRLVWLYALYWSGRLFRLN